MGVKIDMEDDIIRGAAVTHNNEITFPLPPKVSAIAKVPSKGKVHN